jgi:hypothetical protein
MPMSVLGDRAILRVLGDRAILRVLGDRAILRVYRDVKLLGELGDMTILRECKDVTVLKLKMDLATLSVRKNDVKLPMKRGHLSVHRPCKAVPITTKITKLQLPPPTAVLHINLHKTVDIFEVHHIANCQHIGDENGGGGLEGNVGECAGGEESQFAGDGWNMAPWPDCAHHRMFYLQDTCTCVSAVQCNSAVLHPDTYK